jgi:hypothetical protein
MLIGKFSIGIGIAGVYVGEVIVYGSGVPPIARCLRGTLSPQP